MSRRRVESRPALSPRRARGADRPRAGADPHPGWIESAPPNRCLPAAIVIGLLAVAVLAANASYYYPFLADDALISLRYVQRFLHGHGLTWTDGRPVEGYSNFLWMMLAAAFGATGLDLIRSVQVLGFLASAAVVVALCFGFLRGTRRSTVCVAIGSLAWVLSGPAGAWTLAGMEPPLVACLLAWSLVLILRLADRVEAAPRSWLLPGFLLGCLGLTRPDGPLFSLVIGSWLLVRGRFRGSAWRQSACLLSLPVAMFLGQLLFRRAYYREWLPNVAYVKISPSTTHLAAGFQYVLHGLASLRPLPELSLAALVFLCLHRETRSRGFLLLSAAAAWLFYLVFLVGGDIFGAWRHLIPVLVLFILADLLALQFLQSSWLLAPKKWVPLGALLFAWYVYDQFTNERNVWAKSDQWAWNGRVVGLTLKHGFADSRPLLAVTAAGCVPYWSELPCLDLLGLNDYTLARTRPAGWGQGWIGHEVGDSRYVLSLQPDLMLFGTPGGQAPLYVYGRDMPEMPEFKDYYDPCNFAGTVPYYFNSRIWVRRTSPKIGIQRRDNEIFVPPYLLNFTHFAITSLDGEGRFYVTASSGMPVGILDLEIPSGCWRLEEPEQQVRLRVVAPGDSTVLEERCLEGRPSVTVPRADKYSVLLEATGTGEVRIYGLRLVRE